MARVCPLFSGSRGNSWFIGSQHSGILIDAGRSAKQLTEMLSRCELSLSAIRGIFLTHEHTDHVKGLRVFASRHQIPVFSSLGTLRQLEQTGDLDGNFPAEVLEPRGMACGDVFVRPFRTSHDCAEGIGFRVQTADDRTVVLATDLGVLSQEVLAELAGCDVAILESNHDEGMLKNGRYPYVLKQRILSETGHLSNVHCAQALPGLVEQGATRFVLAHLSEENNTPDLAAQTARCSLAMAGCQEGVDFQLYVAAPENPTGKPILF